MTIKQNNNIYAKRHLYKHKIANYKSDKIILKHISCQNQSIRWKGRQE